MNWVRSSYSLLVMIRLLTLATISSRIAARAGTAETSSPAARRTATVDGGMGRFPGGRVRRGAGSFVLARVVELQDGSIDTDLGLFPQVGDIALEGLLALLLEQLELHRAPDLLRIGFPRRGLLDDLED